MLSIYCETFPNGGRIPELCAYGRLGSDNAFHEGANLNPHLEWGGVPDRTESFVLMCIDDDVPTNRTPDPDTGEISILVPRTRFVHWVQANIPASVREIDLGALSADQKTATGLGVMGRNDYRPANMPLNPGDTGTGYDGPCPPMTDARWHTYRFVVFALDTTLELESLFTYDQVEEAMQGHILGMAEWTGRYSLNPRLQQTSDTSL